MRRATRLLMALAALSLVATACSRNDSDSEEVRDILDETVLEPHRFVYTEVTPTGVETVVQGIVEDDFRYQSRLLVEGRPVLDRVVSDDAVAVRFIDTDFLARFVDKEMQGLVDTDTDLDGINVFDALQARRWILDAGGAPPQLVSADAATDQGVDPIFDALRQLERARSATLASEVGFREYSEDSISPTYRTDEDPFPTPEPGSGVTRYDLPQPDFPAAAEAENGVLPGEGVFRKLVIYVKDGQVVRVMEDVGLTPSRLDDFTDYMLRLVRTGAPDNVRAGFEATVAETTGAELGQFLLDGLNTFRELQGDTPVRFRTTSYELLDIGEASLGVDLPTEDVITGDLAVLINLGVKPTVTDDGAGPGAASEDPTSDPGNTTVGATLDDPAAAG